MSITLKNDILYLVRRCSAFSKIWMINTLLTCIVDISKVPTLKITYYSRNQQIYFQFLQSDNRRGCLYLYRLRFSRHIREKRVSNLSNFQKICHYFLQNIPHRVTIVSSMLDPQLDENREILKINIDGEEKIIATYS